MRKYSNIHNVPKKKSQIIRCNMHIPMKDVKFQYLTLLMLRWNFSLFHINIRSVPANLSSLLSDMENLDHRFSVIGLTETWLNPSNIDAYGIEGYNHIGITRSNQNGGGVSLFMSNEISYSELTEFTKVQEYIECLFLKINFKDIIYIIGIVYRPPNSDIEQFTETLNDILSQISHLPCYIMGDYNLDLLKHECHNPTEHF